jgi:hypothetical protein
MSTPENEPCPICTADHECACETREVLTAAIKLGCPTHLVQNLREWPASQLANLLFMTLDTASKVARGRYVSRAELVIAATTAVPDENPHAHLARSTAVWAVDLGLRIRAERAGRLLH